MDYDEWVIAKALLTPQLGFSMDYQMTHGEGDFGIHQAIQFYFDAWSIEMTKIDTNKLLHQNGETNWEINMVDFREDGNENLLTLNEIIQNPKQKTWVLWAFYPDRLKLHPSIQPNFMLAGQKIDWPLYYVVTTESQQTIVWPISDRNIPVDMDYDFSGSIQFPLAFGWDHWDELFQDDGHKLLLSPSSKVGGMSAATRESYDEASLLRMVGLDDLEVMGLNLSQLQSEKLSALFQFLSGWRAFNVLEADKMIEKGSDNFFEIKTEDVAQGLAANGRSSLILRNIIQQSVTPVAELRDDFIVSSSVTPIFAVTLSVKKMPTFGTLNWKIDNLISLLTPMT
jgi:hypothetical protein